MENLDIDIIFTCLPLIAGILTILLLLYFKTSPTNKEFKTPKQIILEKYISFSFTHEDNKKIKRCLNEYIENSRSYENLLEVLERLSVEIETEEPRTIHLFVNSIKNSS